MRIPQDIRVSWKMGFGQDGRVSQGEEIECRK